MGILRRLVRLPLRLAEAERQIRELQSRVFDISRDLQTARAEVDVLWRASKSAETIPCGGCEAPATSRNAHNLPVCDECAADNVQPDDDDDGGSELDAVPPTQAMRARPVARVEAVVSTDVRRGVVDELRNLASRPRTWAGDTLMGSTAAECVSLGWARGDGDGYYIVTDAGRAELARRDAGVAVDTGQALATDADSVAKSTRAPKVGDLVTPDNIASLPVGTVIAEDGTDWTATKYGVNDWREANGFGWNDLAVWFFGLPARILSLPEPAPTVQAPKVGDRVTAENVASLPAGTAVEWERVDGAVHSAVKYADNGWIHAGTGAPMSDGPMVEDPPARIRAIPAQAGPVTAPAPTAKGCRGCANRIGNSIACSVVVAAFYGNGGVGDWQSAHLEGDCLTPKPGAPECPARKEIRE